MDRVTGRIAYLCVKKSTSSDLVVHCLPVPKTRKQIFCGGFNLLPLSLSLVLLIYLFSLLSLWFCLVLDFSISFMILDPYAE